MEKLNQNLAVAILLFLAVSIFFGFGFFHLAKFETVDEHFWKYERVPRYWKKGILEQDWKNTYINDKPGVATAIISGIGLIFEPDPETHRIRDEEITQNQNYTVYDSSRTEKINFALRLPLLIFNSLFLVFFFWIIKKILDNKWLALLAVYLISLSPILVGISQIINPDTLLWTFSAAAIFSYFALMKTDEKKFLALVALFTGLSLLSKYTANLLFLLYPIIFFSQLFIDFQKIKNVQKYILKNMLYYLVIISGSVAIFSVLLPAVFVKAKYLYRGTIGSPTLESLHIPLLIFFGLVFFDTLIWKARGVEFISKFLNKYQQWIFKLASFAILILLAFTLINSLSGERFVSLENLKEEVYVEKELAFPMFDGKSEPTKFFMKMAIQSYPFFYTLLPIIIVTTNLLWIKILWKGIQKYKLYIFFLTILPVIYFFGALHSEVFLNPRYAIILYPLYSFFAVIAFLDLLDLRKEIKKKTALLFFGIVIFITGVFSLWNIKPFYFNYMNIFLPKNQIVTDSWGYGEYEAAEYLNSLPNPKDIVIWSDRSAICQFIKGKCIRDYKIDLEKTQPEYFVISRRGSIRHKFEWENSKIAPKSNLEYYRDDLENNYVWSLYIGDRPDNFVKIIKVEI